MTGNWQEHLVLEVYFASTSWKTPPTLEPVPLFPRDAIVQGSVGVIFVGRT